MIDGELVSFNSGYDTLSNRLINYAKKVYDESGDSYPYTKLWVFSYTYKEDNCNECITRYQEMIDWFQNSGYLDSADKRVTWILEDVPLSNDIYVDFWKGKSNVNIFTNEKGLIYDIYFGVPTIEWLEKYILPII